MRLVLPALLALSFACPCIAQDIPATPSQTAPATLPAKPQPSSDRPKIGLALEGGGALGEAHIGVLKWFEEHHIPIDYLAGTSMGGLVGGMYATGKNRGPDPGHPGDRRLVTVARRRYTLRRSRIPPQRRCPRSPQLHPDRSETRRHPSPGA